MKNWLIGKDPDARKDWMQEEKGKTEVDVVGWHHRLNGLEFEQALGVGDGQESLVCCSPWRHKELDTTEQVNWTDWTTKPLTNSIHICSGWDWCQLEYLPYVSLLPIPYLWEIYSTAQWMQKFIYSFIIEIGCYEIHLYVRVPNHHYINS